MKQPSASDLEQLATPIGFARGVLKLDCYEWAERILCDVDKPGAVAVKAANGAGKTTRLAAPIALWHASVFPGSLTIVTAGVYRQVKEQMFPAIRSHAHKFASGGWKFNEAEIETHNGSRIIGFSTDIGEKFEGWHNENLLMIVDEAKSVPAGIFEAIERCQPKRLLLISSPGGASGHFYDAFHARRKFYRCHSVAARDCPHISETWVQEQIEKYGEHHPLVRSMIYAEFMTSGEDGSIIPLSFVERCLASPPKVTTGTVQAFCDFAAGGDENVLAVRRGNKVEIVAAWRERDTMQAVGRFIRYFHEQQLRPGDIQGDAAGLGTVVLDRMAELGWRIGRANNGATARNSKQYANLGAETWYGARRIIERCEIILPRDRELIGQLTTRRGWVKSDGRLAVETKEDMRARGLPSPDRADAVLGAIVAARVYHSPTVVTIHRRRTSNAGAHPIYRM